MPKNQSLLVIFYFLPFLLFAQGNEYFRIQETIDQLYDQKAYSELIAFVNEQDDSDPRIHNLLTLYASKCYLKTRKYDLVPNTLDRIIDISGNDSLQSYFFGKKEEQLAFYHYLTGDRKNALQHFEKSTDYFNQAKIYSDKVYNHIMAGVIYRKEGEYILALDQYNQGLKHFSQMHPNLDSADYITIKNDIAIIYSKLNYYQFSLSILQELLEHPHLINDKKKADIYNNLSICHTNLGQDTLAYNMLRRAQVLYEKIGDKLKLSILYNNLAHFQQDLFGNIDKSIAYYKQSIDIKKELKDITGLTHSYLNIARLYHRQNDVEKAQQYGTKALKLAEQSGHHYMLKDVHEMLADLYATNGVYEMAYFHQQQENHFQDSIQERNTSDKLQALENSVQMENMQSQLNLAQHERELDQLRAQKGNSTIIILILIFLLALAILLPYIFRLRQGVRANSLLYRKNLELASMNSLVTGQEEERKRIAQELHDGVGNSLTLLVIALQKEKLEHLIQLAQNISNDVRAISYNLMPSGLIKFGLYKSLKELCRTWSTNDTYVDLNYNISKDYFQDQSSTITIYRVIQEILKNAITKGNATYVSVLFKSDDEKTSIIVEDNGDGFDVKKVKKGLGIDNIRNRVTYLKGDMQLHSNQGGTSYMITIPNFEKLS